MTQNEILTHIHAMLDGSNYTVWFKSMRSFLKGCKLWLYLTGDVTSHVAWERGYKVKAVMAMNLLKLCS
jgi:hypothetical protein